MKNRITVLLCDDHVLFRDCLKEILKDHPSIHLVAEASRGREAVEIAGRLRPDVAVMEVALPDLDGFDATSYMTRASSRTRVVILTGHEEEETITRSLRAGASAYVLKDSSRADLIHAIETAKSGGQYLSPRVLKKIVKEHVKRHVPSASSYQRLSAREREVLKLLADGMALKEIAARLGLSVKTVDVHKTNMMHKLDLHERSEVVKYAIQCRVISLPSNKDIAK
jgi:DNA-binding NarL/FixJ family response regulator